MRPVLTTRKPMSTRKPMPRNRAVLAGLAGLACGVLLLSACTSKPQVQSSQSATERELVFARSSDASSQVVAEAYTEMLESAGVKATLGNPVADPVAEVLAGKADAVIAGSGTLLAALGKESPTSTGPASSAAPSGGPGGSDESAPAGSGLPLNAEQTLQQLHQLDLEGYALLDSADAARTGTLVISAATSAGKGLTMLAQLPPLCPELDFGVPKPLAAGLVPELERIYACTPRRVIPVVPQDDATVGPLITDQVQVLATTSDNAGIPDNGLVVVQDAQALFEPQTLVPLITTRQLGQDAIDAINKVSAALKQEDLVALNRAVTGRDGLDPEKAAIDWLREKSLIATP